MDEQFGNVATVLQIWQRREHRECRGILPHCCEGPRLDDDYICVFRVDFRGTIGILDRLGVVAGIVHSLGCIAKCHCCVAGLVHG